MNNDHEIKQWALDYIKAKHGTHDKPKSFNVQPLSHNSSLVEINFGKYTMNVVVPMGVKKA